MESITPKESCDNNKKQIIIKYDNFLNNLFLPLSIFLCFISNAGFSFSGYIAATNAPVVYTSYKLATLPFWVNVAKNWVHVVKSLF